MGSHLPVHWLPLAIAVWMPLSFGITYILAVSAGHVYPWLPSISATGTSPPESCWFGLFVNLSTFLLLFAGYIRHAQVREYSHCRPTTGPRKCTNLLATTIGLVSVIGLFIVANWQMTSAIRVHYFGSQCCFYGANIYFIFQTVFSFWMAPQLNSLQIFVLRALLSLLMVSLNIGTNVCNYMAWKLYNNFNPNSSYKDHLLWNPTDPGYGWHLAYTIMEWCLMLTLSLAVLSFFPDFQRIKLEEPAIKMKRLWKDERSSTSRV
ncbi:DNA damage-regulated autophagy modulator protein 1-like [Macrosteles quadrilineatus]|uniref:DNA damage-regulated autophagy modulator protein 1-like n=1 Tax=Macrosteles quadrilineatus TaxID=74068 RepID=UPI0023E2581B|nr:DNA damage-regulated autophagy modulator protein 1-like [Macrosteles quadrilineatus]